jgi:hypothetical protein
MHEISTFLVHTSRTLVMGFDIFFSPKKKKTKKKRKKEGKCWVCLKIPNNAPVVPPWTP